MSTSIRSEGVGGFIVTTGIILVSIAGGPADPSPADCVDPDIVQRPDSTLSPYISVFEPTKKVDTTMVQSPAPACKNQFSPPPNRD